MYSVQLDEQGYFTGSYAKIGSILGGEMVETLPSDMDKATGYKYGIYEVKEDVEVPEMDVETGKQKIDEEGDLLFTKQETTNQVVGWQFDEEKYKKFQEEKELENIRKERMIAFKVIDKYQLILAYQDLTQEQKEQLIEYRKAWLDAPSTRVLPGAPIWL